MTDFDSPPDLDWSDLENVHERVGHMLHSFARLLPPASDILDIPSRPVPREQKSSIPKFSGIPRHRETWLQDMMNSFSTDAQTAKNITLHTGGAGLMTSDESHPPFKPDDLAAEQQKKQQEAVAAAQHAMFGPHLDQEAYHSAIMMAAGYSQSNGPYSRTFPQLQQQNFMMSQHQQQQENPKGVTRTMMRRGGRGGGRGGGRSMSPQQRSGSSRYNNNNNNNNRSRSQRNNNNQQRQGRAVSNRRPNNRNNNTKRNNKKSQSPATATATKEEEEKDKKPRQVPGAVVAPKNTKKKTGGVPTSTRTATSQNKKASSSSASPADESKRATSSTSNNNNAAATTTTRSRSTVGRFVSKSKRNTPEEGDLTYVYVEFKRNRLRKIPCNEFPVETGQYVIVFGDRDFDMGLVVAKEVFEKDNSSCRVSLDLMDTVEFTEAQLERVRPERDPVIRLATNAESDHLQNDFPIFEENSKKVCQYYCTAYGIPIEIVDAELQFDGKKISFFFNHPEVIDFRGLVQDLFKVFNARIWMENVNDKQRQLTIPPKKDPRASSANNNNRNRSQSRGATSNHRNRSQSPAQQQGQEQGQGQEQPPAVIDGAATTTTTAATTEAAPATA